MKVSPATALILIFVTLVHVVVIAAVSPLVSEPELLEAATSESSSPPEIPSENPGIDTEAELAVIPEPEKKEEKKKALTDSVVLTHPLRAPEQIDKEETSEEKETRDPVARLRPNQGEFAKRIKSPHLESILRGEGQSPEMTRSGEKKAEAQPAKPTKAVSRTLRQITPIAER